MLVRLQRQRRAGLDLDALDLEARSLLQHGEGAPGPHHRPVHAIRLIAARLQLADDVLHSLQLIAVRHEHGVGCVDDEQAVDTDGRDDAVLGVDVGVARRDCHALTLAAIALGVTRHQIGDGLP